MKITSLADKTAPLCFLPDGRLVCFQIDSILIFKENEEQQRIPLFFPKKKLLINKCNILYRLLRLGIRAAIAIDNDTMVFSSGNVIQELNLKTGELSEGYVCEGGTRPLAFTKVTGIEGIEDGVYFGAYYHNFEKKPVSIYYRAGVDDWRIVFAFPGGVINHIHNILPDPFQNCLWIMTGDFGDAAALWKATDGFKKVIPFVRGNQCWRGCVGFPTNDGLLYATDTPFADNHIYLLNSNGRAEKMGDLAGSCIYGCQWKDKFVFASTVEADGRDETIWKLLTSKKRGSGIVDNFIRLYIGDVTNGFKVVYKEKKDWLPFIFQFGSFRFPAGANNSDSLYFQPVATRTNDLALLKCSLDEEDIKKQ